MRAMSCSKVVGRAIRKFGLAAVQAAVEMAVELGNTTSSMPATRISKNKVIGKQAGMDVKPDASVSYALKSE